MTLQLPQSKHFQPLEQAAFRSLEHAAYLKGFLKPFKGKGSLETWAKQCFALRDAMMGLAEHPASGAGVPFQSVGHPTGPTTYWRRYDLSALAQP